METNIISEPTFSENESITLNEENEEASSNTPFSVADDKSESGYESETNESFKSAVSSLVPSRASTPNPDSNYNSFTNEENNDDVYTDNAEKDKMLSISIDKSDNKEDSSHADSLNSNEINFADNDDSESNHSDESVKEDNSKIHFHIIPHESQDNILVQNEIKNQPNFYENEKKKTFKKIFYYIKENRIVFSFVFILFTILFIFIVFFLKKTDKFIEKNDSEEN